MMNTAPATTDQTDLAEPFFAAMSAQMAQLALDVSKTEDAVGQLISEIGGMHPALMEPLQSLDRISQVMAQLSHCLDVAAIGTLWPKGPPPELHNIRLLEDLKPLLATAPVEAAKTTAGDLDWFS